MYSHRLSPVFALRVPYHFFLYPRSGISSSSASYYYYLLFFYFWKGREAFFCFFSSSFFFIFLCGRGVCRLFLCIHLGARFSFIFLVCFLLLFLSPPSTHITKSANRGRRHKGRPPQQRTTTKVVSSPCKKADCYSFLYYIYFILSGFISSGLSHLVYLIWFSRSCWVRSC
ncbi:hypothetical protein DFP73DRAFT_555090 [Morchella snyderi]|nr:hypothetical protein DFP73DRAFT_555090 [Morchella snyderi]